ncbi:MULTISPECIES: ferredoxin family protein [unclassified Beijerinckia]|uniref:4Fe-4S dicluster domain-containing protein n=1 Tax=unclassified Beijerinckia TaxID=2638183 RepID=UPI00089C1053|nr:MULTISPECIES: ferredoxin family protein [unclassified Beijerinckia]MDH7795467.1 NAD-dependent dihydropyrimidine dehydrogenase PreA subunit [Beijerinckia sp. GAS462]SEC02778.1 NAD-dependent dihydropyrimidine dehydrogenase, PreA subunit [Beijerinckia sp. 28-YEA-48]
MIELVSESRCINCDLCVAACPDNVFDAVADAPPVIARQQDCQTCFLCELYCPADALYVSPLLVPDAQVNEAELVASGLLGSFRREMGWRSAKPRGTHLDLTHRMFADNRVAP